MLNVFAALATVLAITFVVWFIKCCAATEGVGCGGCYYLMAIAVSFFTLAASLFLQASNLDTEIQSLQAELDAKEKMCESESYMQYASSTYSIPGAFSEFSDR